MTHVHFIHHWLQVIFIVTLEPYKVKIIWCQFCKCNPLTNLVAYDMVFLYCNMGHDLCCVN
jgi:hypothetical protein